jgi:hypothetical protein
MLDAQQSQSLKPAAGDLHCLHFYMGGIAPYIHVLPLL